MMLNLTNKGDGGHPNLYKNHLLMLGEVGIPFSRSTINTGHIFAIIASIIQKVQRKIRAISSISLQVDNATTLLKTLDDSPIYR